MTAAADVSQRQPMRRSQPVQVLPGKHAEIQGRALERYFSRNAVIAPLKLPILLEEHQALEFLSPMPEAENALASHLSWRFRCEESEESYQVLLQT